MPIVIAIEFDLGFLLSQMLIAWRAAPPPGT